jgi:hypothetical protein
MHGTIVERQIRRCNRHLLLVNAGLIGLCLLSLVLAQRYLYNCVAGPFPVSANELLSMTPASGSRNYVAVTDDFDAKDTGVYEEHTISGVPTGSDHFLAAPLGGRLLLIKASTETPQKHYKGAVSAIPPGIRRLLEEDVRKEGRQFSDLFLPTMLDATSYRSDAYFFLLIGLPTFGFCVRNVKKALSRMEDHKHSPVYAAINRYDASPEKIAAILDAEASSDGVVNCGSFTLTHSWLLHKTFFNFTPFHLDEIVWTYPKQTTTYYYGVIPVGQSHSLVIADAAGRTAESNLGRGRSRKKSIQEFITMITTRAPWIVFGYDDELKAAYHKNRQEFVAAVAERRRAHDEAKLNRGA